MSKFKNRKLVKSIVTNGLLSTICFVMIFPVLYGVMTSFKTQGDVITFPPTFFPPVWSLEGYKTVLNSDMFRIYLPNTAFNAFMAALLAMPIAALAGYSFSRYKFRGSKALRLAILGLMMIPGLTNLLALYSIGSRLRILNSHWTIIVWYAAGGVPYTIWIIKAFFDAVPREMEEAALIDGCSPLRSLWHIVIPLAMPGLFASFLMNFVGFWNEFLAALILITSNDARTATIGLYDFQSQYEIAFHVLSAACIIIMMPVLIIFIIGHKTFFRAMMQGALKG
jgi:ABC-type glycerol-3-phosphate transport system permease component